MGLWDSITDFFTKIEYDKEEVKKKEKELNQWLADQQKQADKKLQEAYNNGYKNGFPKEEIFEYKQAQVDDDKTIEEKVNSEYQDEWNSSKKQLEEAFEDTFEEYKKDAEEYENSALEKHRDIENNYAKNKDKVQNNAIKNGLVNSSIMTESHEELEKIKDMSIMENAKDLEQKIKDIDAEIEKLTVERELKKNRLDSDFRKKIDSKINSLKADRQKEIDKVDKYNKEVEAKEKQYAQELRDYEKNYDNEWRAERKEHDEYVRKNGYVGEEKQDYDKRLKNAYDFYKQLPKKDAIEMIQNNPNLRKYLGYNYSQLLREINK